MRGQEAGEGAGHDENQGPAIAAGLRTMAFGSICIDYLLLSLHFINLIPNWVDQQLFFLEGIIRIINKAKWRVWTTNSRAFCVVMSLGAPPTLTPPQRNHFPTMDLLPAIRKWKAEVSEKPHTSLFGRNQG